MCGICGEVRFDDAAVEADVIVAMRDELAHRGPDATGLYVSPDRRVGLGFRRLGIIDLSNTANQPMPNEDGSVQLVFNGEIYNFRALRHELEQKGHRFRSNADSEVIVHLYEEEGADAVRRFEGMFALAIWDHRRRELTLARDRAGKKPLFYHRTGSRLLFGSEMKALLGHPDVQMDVDVEAIPYFFTHGYVPGPGTLYRNISQVPPATVMTFGAAGQSRESRYWRLEHTPAGSAPAARGQAAGDPVQEVRRLVTEAVERRLMSDVPLGAFLSGGVDSTIVVGVMSRLLGRPVKTFSIGFQGQDAYDETSYAQLAATRFGAEHTPFRIGPPGPDLVDRLIWHHDGPFGDASAIPTSIVAELTRRQVTVVLTGDGGDEVFAGYRRFSASLLAERVPRPVSRALAAISSRLPSHASERHWLAELQRFTSALELPLHERLTRWTSLFYDDLPGLIAPDVWSRTSFDPMHYLHDELGRLDRLSALGKLQHATFATYLPGDLLVKMDRCTMAHSLEARSPFLDRSVVEYAAGLPDALKLHGRHTKIILKEAFRDLLPPEIARRPKMGFGVPLGAWFRGQWREYLADHLLDPGARYRSYLSAGAVHQLVERHLSGRTDAGPKLWAVLCFERWLRLMPDWTRRPLPVASVC